MNHLPVILIAAMANNRAIGFENKLPWRLSADLKRFKSLTLGNAIIMGRNTFESLGNKPLPGRTNIVVSATLERTAENVHVTPTLELALEFARSAGANVSKIFIIGGAQIYKSALTQNLADEIDLTVVNLEPVADTFFPEFESIFKLISELPSESEGVEFKLQRWVKF